ncbi:PREDICTED: laminin subunit gamma-2-like [Chaetura pelagica]|uniref:laminin subunit gamma-2-like n=1 Tax=Chaetura pelagica TaxID=8897 RepID=UPI0005235060|nr:PREDICTED: laminin subunit gamma-2-like [Chaetura pelagica]
MGSWRLLLVSQRWALRSSWLSSLHLPASLPLSAACECHGMPRRCVLDWQLLRDTGQGWRCVRDAAGPPCERCPDGFFRRRDGTCCLPCRCHPRGSLSPQCDSHGQCSCKPGVMGEKCDQCQPGFHSLSEAGCQRSGQSLQCECDPAGSLGGCPSGRCVCKEGVTGEHCERCKGSFYNLDARNPLGCSPCFCYGHSATCVSADNYSAHNITSTFQQGAEGWRGVQGSSSPAQLQWSPRHQDVFLTARTPQPIYFVAPAKFLGNQQLSYSQILSFDYRLDRGGLQPSLHDVVLEGDGLRVTAPFLPQGKVLPCGVSQTYTFRLDEQPSSNWSPRLNHLEYRRLLGNLTGLWIRGTFGEYSTGYLDNVTLVPAQAGAGAPAPWVERCECPAGHWGQFCQTCAPGFHRDVPSLGPFSACVPCHCPGGGICDPDTGECYSGDEDVGDSVTCPFGSYRDPRQPQVCRACPCSNGQGCSVVPGSEEVSCDQCPPGAAGKVFIGTDDVDGKRMGGKVDLYLQQLAELEVLLSEEQAGGGSESQELEGRMQLAEEMLQTILGEALGLQASDRSLESRLASMKGQGSRSQSCVDETKATVERLRSLRSQYERQVQDTRHLLERARLDLDRSGAALRRVNIPVSNLPGGSSQLLLLAQEAMRLANSQLDAVGAAGRAAAAARGDGQQGLRLLQEAGQGGPGGSPAALLARYEELKSLAGGLKAEAEGLGPQAHQVYQGSLELLSSLSRLTKTDIGSFEGEVALLKKEASALLSLLDTSVAQHRQLQSSTGRWEEEIKELLRKGEGERATLTRLLSRANLARSTALQALSAGNATFSEVEQILKSLREFMLQADDKRREAEDAMRRLPTISSVVTRAREKTDRAEATLGSAASESKAASSAAEEAKDITMRIQQEITGLRMEANRTADGVLALEKAVASLQRESKGLDGEFERKFSEVEADAAALEETAQEAQRVHAKAGEAGVAVQETLSALEELLRLMNQPGAVDEDGLKQLEKNFSRAKSRSKQLKDEVLELEQTAAVQKARVQTLESSIDEILVDIKNLEDIQRSLPWGCYNTKAIELP